MMDLNQYLKDVSRTIVQPPKVVVNPQLLYGALGMFFHSANILDQVKKFIYYKKPLDRDRIIKSLMQIAEAHRKLQYTSLEAHDQELLSQPIPIDSNIFHAILGIATEAGELVEHLKFDGKPMDKAGISDELGDSHWYHGLLVMAMDIDWNSVFDANIKKLKARYPEKFTEQDALLRDIANEREVVEKALKPKPITIKKKAAVRKKKT